MRNLGSFVENGLIETKIWMLGTVVIPEASLLMDFFQLIEEEKNACIYICKYEYMYLYAYIHI